MAKKMDNHKVTETQQNQDFPAMGGVEEDKKFYRCLDCNCAWKALEISRCPKCRSKDVSQCSEFLYDQLAKCE